MRFLLPILCLLHGLGGVAFAQTEHESASESAAVESPSEPAVAEKKVTRIRQNSSEYFRMGKSFQVTAEGGFPTLPLAAAGGAAAVFLGRNSLLDVDYVRANDTWFGYKAEIVMGGVHFQQFLANSFYIKGGVDYRMVRLYDAWNIFFGGSRSGEFARHDSIGPSFAVGNQWQWEHFVIGCDWGGLYIPAVILKSEYNKDNVASSDTDSTDRGWNTASRTALMAVRFHVGVSW